MGKEVINRVHKLAEEEDQPKIASNFKFEWRLEGALIEDDEESDKNENIEELSIAGAAINPTLMDIDKGYEPHIMEEQDNDYEVILQDEDNMEEPQVQRNMNEDEEGLLDEHADTVICHDDVEGELDEEQGKINNEGDGDQQQEGEDDEHGDVDEENSTPVQPLRTTGRIRKPTNSHRNAYEREFSHAILGKKICQG